MATTNTAVLETPLSAASSKLDKLSLNKPTYEQFLPITIPKLDVSQFCGTPIPVSGLSALTGGMEVEGSNAGMEGAGVEGAGAAAEDTFDIECRAATLAWEKEQAEQSAAEKRDLAGKHAAELRRLTDEWKAKLIKKDMELRAAVNFAQESKDELHKVTLADIKAEMEVDLRKKITEQLRAKLELEVRAEFARSIARPDLNAMGPTEIQLKRQAYVSTRMKAIMGIISELVNAAVEGKSFEDIYGVSKDSDTVRYDTVRSSSECKAQLQKIAGEISTRLARVHKIITGIDHLMITGRRVAMTKRKLETVEASRAAFMAPAAPGGGAGANAAVVPPALAAALDSMAEGAIKDEERPRKKLKRIVIDD
jgi:hypothetical protein